MILSRVLASLLVLLVTACAGAPSGPSTLEPDGDARLDGAVVPLAYDLQLSIDPAQDRFDGQVAIAMRLASPVREIRLHGRELTVASVEAGGVTGTAREGREGGLLLSFPDELPAGDLTLRITWSAPLREGLAGLYRVRAGDAWYAYTQLEALDARRMFPCFDEPRFKTPFAVTVHIPHGNLAAGNAPIASSERDDRGHRVRFEPTGPLPTYLVALAVGPFEVVEGEPASGTPVRLLAPGGSGELGRFALSRVGPVVKQLTDYFGQPLPFPKLDLVAVPAFGFSAMENPGLITFRDARLLLDSARLSEEDRIQFDALLAHELAHFWFGDLVTMAWWDEVWLNEGLASFMGAKVVEALHPGVGADMSPARGAGEVMMQDGLGSARAVRQPIRDGGDVRTAFDGITYVKGMAVLRMLESWMGREVFQKGLKAYVAAHAGGNATTLDLLAALEKVSGLPVRQVADSFLDQAGVPLITGELVCTKDKVVLRLAQERYKPLGSTAGEGTWRVPVCVAWDEGPARQRQCALLQEARAEVVLTAKACPERLHLNAGEAGYYRWFLPERDLTALVRAEPGLPGPEAVGLGMDLDALLLAGRIAPKPYLEALPVLLASKRRVVVEGAIASLWRLDRAVIRGTPAREEAFARFVQRGLGERGRRLGVLPVQGERAEDELLRPSVIGALTELGKDPGLRRSADDLAGRWVTNPTSVPAAAAKVAVPLAARRGGSALQTRLLAMLDTVRAPADRTLVLSALGSFRIPELLTRSLSLYLEPRSRASDFWPLAGAASSDPATRPVLLTFIDRNHDAIVAKLGDGAAALPSMGAGACTDEDAARLEKLFAAPSRKLSGTERKLAQALESIRTCARLRGQIAAGVAEALTKVESTAVR